MHANARAEQPRLTHHRGSQVHLDEWVAPDIADERGFLRAGKILEWMDVVGVVAPPATAACPSSPPPSTAWSCAIPSASASAWP